MEALLPSACRGRRLAGTGSGTQEGRGNVRPKPAKERSLLLTGRRQRYGSRPVGNDSNIETSATPIAFVFLTLFLLCFPNNCQAQLTSDLSFTIDEGRPPETLVGTVPVNEGSTYRFSTEQMYFSIHSTSGEIRTTTEIDREELDSDVFDISVLEIREGSGNIPIEVQIVVNDINDNPPTFSDSETERSLSESASVGSRILLPSATDPDLGVNGTVSNFAIVSGNVNSTFELEFIQFGSGILRLKLREKLDRERTDFYQLRIVATDQGIPPLNSSLVVNLSISDVNDNAPIFEFPEYRFSLNESTLIGTEVLQVTATDLDVGRNGEIMYSFRQPNSYFAVDPVSGVITLISKLVYESESYHSFKLEARDQGVPSQQGRADVYIEVIDINDHDPHITVSFLSPSDNFASVEEGAQVNSVVAIVTVTDADQGDNGAVNVFISEGNELGHFQLLSIPLVTGIFRVSVVGMLDREVIPEYNLTIQAEDMGIPRRRSMTMVRIVVLDANDHSPVFESDAYSTTITENVPVGSYVESVSASDDDTGDNADISYTISSGNDLGWFEIDSESGLVTTASAVDRETASVVTLTVTASDRGRQPLTTSVELAVTIADVNDVVPLFTNQSYQASVLENAQAGIAVVKVHARDEDEGNGGVVEYSFADDSLAALSMFAINPQTGLITTLIPLDREEVGELTLSVKAKDLGQPSLFSMAMVNVIVFDENDNSPIFYPEEYFASVNENEVAPAPVVTVTATDADINNNGKVTYFMIDNGGGNFQIDTDTGEIVTTRALDRETQSHFTITVSALDGGAREALQSAVVYVAVADIQDNPPTFHQSSYVFQILENIQPDSFVGVVSASSQDLEVNITFRIFSGDPEGHFKIHPETGEIRTKTEIDRETMSSYNLVVYAHAASLTGDAAVTIMVGDINDNPPLFSTASASADVVVDWSIGHQFYQAQAHDSDVPPNSLIAYELSSNPGSFFNIDPTSGWVYIAADLKTASQNDFSLEIRATDHGTPQLSSTQTLLVQLRDVNIHSPIFQERYYTVSISENIKPTVRFIQVEAIDADDGSNGLVMYNITTGNDDDKFGIFPDGQVYVRDSLDREATPEYQLTITASDNGVPPKSAVASLAISVEDVNDNRPVFSNGTYDFYLREEEASPIVGMVEAVDRDVGLNGEVTYSIITNQTYFQIGSKNGLITSDHIFDREQEEVNSFFLEVEASDGGNNTLSERIVVNIHIMDINDNSPIFMQSDYQTAISELAPINANVIIVSAVDNDVGDNSFLTYSIISGNSENTFSMNHASGQISLANTLDRETFSAYNLVVKAEDAGVPPLTATANVLLTILDENDHHPVFQDRNVAVEITECVQIDDLVTSVLAFDEDVGQNSLISYSIVGGNARGIFYMDPNNGNLYLAKLLDHETDAEYHLNVSAQDSGSPPLAGFASVIITVRDCNDNAPTFAQSTVVREINEELSAGTEVVTVLAQDFDSGINGQVVYSVLTQEPNMNFFQIDPETGAISVDTPIDLETLPLSSKGLVQLTVQAIDQALPIESRQSATASVTFIVRDINDNRPEIISQSATAVSASSPVGTPVISVVAVDMDSGSNAKVTFNLISRGLPFTINSTSGLVTVSGIISRSASPYSLQIRASDGGSPPLSSEITLSVIVTELQSTGPLFSQNSYSAQLEENQPVGTPVLTVFASYSNGRTATVEYYITSISLANMENRNYFSIGKSSGLISTSVAIDHEAFVGVPVFTVVVTAADVSAVPPKTRDVEVLITIIDVNDNPPFFQDFLYNTSVPEDAEPGTHVLTVVATDADSPELGNVRYSITSGSDGHFDVDPSSGRITLQGSLDRETKDGYMLTVQATDGVLFSTSQVAVRILDQNDNPPVFTEDVYSFQVAEDAGILSVIDRISANDLDEGSNGVVRYQVVQEGALGETVFGLDPVTGELSLLQEIDFEEKQLYYLKVQASDQGSPSLTAVSTVYVSVVDVNDNTPVFSPSRYSVEVSESAAVGHHLTTVYAQDADSGPNAMIQYSIQSGDAANRFAILPNGTVIIAQPLDRESQSFYNLEIRGEDMAVDGQDRKYSTAQVSVIVLDINDNAPVFTSPSEVHVLESAIPGTLVMTVIAEDPDVERNSYVEYSLDPVPGESFIIQRDNGNLFVWSYLDREIQPTFNLTVVATDKGTPSKSSTMMITVILDDVNDNNPIFEQTEYHATVPENIPVGIEFLEIIATDPDLGSNAWITYTIEDGNYNSDFMIDVQTGVLSVAKTLDHERRQSYTLTIRAQDSGPGSRFSRCSVVVDVEDVNDNFPVFLDTYRPVVTENNLPGEVVVQVVADDLDQGANGALTYSLQGNTYGSLFTIDRTTGVIRVTERLDHEDAVDYSLTVVAEDAGTPQLMGITQVIIRVADANDHQPQFLSDVYTTSIEEEVPLNTDVLRVVATDIDSSAMLRYRLDGDVGNKFTIYPFTGHIVTAGRLDREEQSYYELTVTVTDSEERTASARVLITVTDIDDNQPRFVSSSYEVTLPENANAGTLVTVVKAMDVDVGVNAANYYTIEGGDTSIFSIDHTTGAITISQNLSDQTGEFILQVGVRDLDGSEISDYATVHVIFQFKLLTSYPSINLLGRTQITLTENQPVGEVLVVHADSPKPGTAGQLTFHFAGGNEENYFGLDSETGNLTLQKMLDFETENGFHLWVEARDGDNPPLSSFSDIIVSVLDVNDNSPVFEEEEYVGTVTEGTSSIQEVLQVVAHDQDSGIYGDIRYSIRSETNPNNAFRIDEVSGVITTTRILDREATPSYQLAVEAVDFGSPAKSGSTVVMIEVEDINDNAMYTTDTFEGTVKENAMVGAFVMKVATQDADIGQNAISRYRITSGNTGGAFAIDELSGDITVNSALDRESPGGSQFQLVVEAFDDAFTLDIPVTIEVLDVNDNPPVFMEDMYEAQIPELQPEGTFVIAVSAEDRDEGDNSRVRYQLKALSGVFTLDPITGHVTTGEVLEYKKPNSVFTENTNIYQFNVLAVDYGFPTLYSEVTVTVEVFDANDHAPVFDRSSYFSPVPAGTLQGVEVIQVHAQDNLDQGPNAEVSYFIEGGNGTSHFDVHEESGWVRVLGNILEGTIGTRYTLMIRAQDKGRPTPLSSTTVVELVITSANIYTPQFSQGSLTTSVREDQPPGLVGTLVATDQDNGINGQITYSIISGNGQGMFSVDALSGDIYLEKELDYEEESSYTLKINATDGGWEKLTATALFVVNVEDVDDNPPVFQEREYFTSIPENSPSAKYVTSVMAVDADSEVNAQFTYSIIGGDGQSFFTINEEEGSIWTQGRLDYEQGQQAYELTVAATNQDGSQRDIAHVHIEVTGVNEFSPQFLRREYEYSVSEGAPDGAPVGSVLAVDSDAGVDGKVIYVLIGASNDVGFAINAETGQIIVSKENGILDRETQEEVVLSVLAKNEGPLTGSNIDETKVRIHIVDANDAPVFSPEYYTATVREDAQPQTYITTVTATEYDQQPAFRQFIYTFREDTNHDVFAIDEITGRITVHGALDRETTAVYHLTVAAVDTGNPPMTGTAQVTVTVEDVNDNGPVLVGSNAEGRVAENQAPNTYVMTLNATDPDANSNPLSFRYRLSPVSDVFTLDDFSGELRTIKTLDREEQSEYFLQVEISDGGSPLMTATSTLHIIVEDQNDQLSSSRNARIEVKMYESNFVGGPIGVTKPIDGDLGDEYECEITSGDLSQFSIEPGCVLYARSQTQERQYTLNITGSDGQHPPVLSSFMVTFQAYDNETLDASITVTLTDINAEDFLGQRYDQFLATMSTILPAREELMVLSLSDIDDSTLGVLLAVKRRNGYTSSDNLRRLFEDNRDTIETRAGITIGTIDFSTCDSNPCLNQGTCRNQHKVHFTPVAVESIPVILVAPVSEYAFTCECGSEFSGQYCENHINQCDSQPCLNSAVCNDLVGDYSCQCLVGFTGKECQTNIDDCSPNPCRNGGICADLINGYRCECLVGYSGDTCQDGPCAVSPCMNDAPCEESGSEFMCQCPFGYWGNRCEHLSVGFSSGAFMEFPSLDQEENSIIIEFSTTLPNSLLVYSHDGTSNQNGHFFLLEVKGGEAHFSFNLGAGVVSMTTEKKVDDGHWHRVQAIRKAQNAELFILDEECNFLPEQACRATGVSSSFSQVELLLNGTPMFVGGVDSLEQLTPRAWQASSVDFVGCMRQIMINGQDLDIQSATRFRDVTEGCSRQPTLCESMTCGDKGTCIDEWWDSWCRCDEGAAGETCDQEPSPSSFGGDGFVEYHVKESYRRQQLLQQAQEGSRRRRATAPQTVSLSFRTRTTDGMLLFVQSGQKFTLLEVEDSMVRYSFGTGDYSQGTILLESILVSDGVWHNVTLERDDKSIFLQVDDSGNSRNFNILPHDFTGLQVTTLSLGGSASEVEIDGEVLKGFSGCITGFSFNGEPMPFSGANERFDVVPSQNVRSGCSLVNPCASKPCSTQETCVSDGASFTCVPQPCLSSPCFNGICYARGDAFICSCMEGFSGDLCDKTSTQTATGDPGSSVIIISVIAVVVLCIILVVIIGAVLLRKRQKRKPKSPKPQTGVYVTNGSMDNPSFINNDTFDDATMIGYHGGKLPDDLQSSMQRQPDIIDQNVQSSAVPSSSSPEVDKVEDITHSDNYPEHYDIENASSIAPSDIDVAYHYRHYHDREGRRKKHRRSPNPMLARIQASPSRESPLSINRQSPHPFIGRTSPSIFGNSTHVPHSYRHSPNVMVMQTMDGGVDIRRAASPYRDRNIPTPVGSEHSELRSLAHRSDVSSVRSGRTGRTKSPMSGVSVPSHRSKRSSRAKTPVLDKNGQPKGLTTEEVARLNSARPDLMSGTHSHTSTIDNLSSVSDDANMNNLSQPTLLEPPDSSSDESAASFTCSEMEPDIDVDTGTYIMTKLASIDNLHAAQNGRLDSDGGSQRTPFSSEDENGGSKGPESSSNGHFSLDQLLNWGPSFQNLSPVCRDIALLNDLSSEKKVPKVQLDTNINGEEFV